MGMPDSEQSHMQEVDTVPWGPTEADEVAVLDKFYSYDETEGTYSFHMGDGDV